MPNVTDIAKMIDHSILHPTFTDVDLERECSIAVKYNVAAVCVKPYHTQMASNFVKGSSVAVCAVIGFPHGNSSLQIKVAETIQVIGDGATEVDMVINIGKALQHDWDYVEQEIKTLNEICTGNGAILKVIFETDFVNSNTDIIKLCELCSQLNVAFVKTSTGYGFVKGTDGNYSYQGATDRVLKLMREHSSAKTQIKAAGGVRNIKQLLKVKELGATRVGATSTETIIAEAEKMFNI